MNDFFEIAKYTFPSLIVFATAYLLIKAFLQKECEKGKRDIALKNQKESIRIRLQAYERLCLFLERIHPESLIIRENAPGLNNQQLQQKLLVAIRTEYEHNLSQQVYVSDKAWMRIKNAKENTIQVINSQAARLAPADSSIGLSKAVIEAYMQQQKPAIDLAISELKTEIRKLWSYN